MLRRSSLLRELSIAVAQYEAATLSRLQASQNSQEQLLSLRALLHLPQRCMHTSEVPPLLAPKELLCNAAALFFLLVTACRHAT